MNTQASQRLRTPPRPPWLTRLERAVRWREWYDSKLLMFLVAILYAACVRAGEAGTTPAACLALLIGLAMLAAFGHMVNDFADRDADRIAGKYRPLAHWPKPAAAAVVAVAALGAELPVWLAFGPWAGGLMAATLLVAYAYSMPPLRVKERGLWGWAAAAMAQRTLPAALVFVALDVRDAGAVLFCLLMTLIGLRFIAVHQLADRAADRQAGVRTVATAADPASLVAVLHLLFAAEVAVLAAAVATMSVAAPPLALVAAGYAAWIVGRRLRGTPVAPTDYFVLSGFYHVLWPLTLAVTLAARDPRLWPAVVLVVALSWNQVVRDVLQLWRAPLRQRPPSRPAAATPAQPINRGAIEAAAAAGLAALERMQHPDGSFALSTGTQSWRPCSPLFSTAYIMLGAGRHLPPEARARAVAYLRRERQPDGLWVYDPAEPLPPDADSSACALAALAFQGCAEITETDAALLRAFWRAPQGPFRTWKVPGPLSDPERDDPVVNSNVILALRALGAPLSDTECGAAETLLRRSIGPSRYYCAPATLAHAAVRAGLAQECMPPVAKARPPDADTLACAQWLCAFPAAPDADTALAAVLRGQRGDGSWPIAPWVTAVGEPRRFWGSAEISTALAVEALRSAANVIRARVR